MYTVVDLGAGIEPTDIDASGNVLVNRGVGQSPALVRTTGQVVDIAATVGVPIYRAFGMNDVGQIAAEGDNGWVCQLATGIARAIPIKLPLAINDVGTVVGKHEGHPVLATLTSSSATQVFADGSEGSALAINDAGTVVGVGFVGSLANQVSWSFAAGMLKALTTGNPSIATAINSAGTIVGVDDGKGFLIDPVLGKLDVLPAGTSLCSLLDVDDIGRYVGLVQRSGQRRGIVGRGAATSDLTSLLVAKGSIVVEAGVAVNSAGWIAAVGTISGAPHGLLLKPLVVATKFRALALLVHILHGGRLDDDGIGIGPGGPEPIGPGPLRDGLIGMALGELAELLDDRGTRTAVRALALERVHVALEVALDTVGASVARRGSACELGCGFPVLGEL